MSVNNTLWYIYVQYPVTWMAKQFDEPATQFRMFFLSIQDHKITDIRPKIEVIR